MNSSIASVDVPLKKPMFESTVLGEGAAKISDDPLVLEQKTMSRGQCGNQDPLCHVQLHGNIYAPREFDSDNDSTLSFKMHPKECHSGNCSSKEDGNDDSAQPVEDLSDCLMDASSMGTVSGAAIESNATQHIGCRQQITHTLSLSSLPHQSLSEASNNSSSSCVRKVSRSSGACSPPPLADSRQQESISTSGRKNLNFLYGAAVDPTSIRPSPVVRTRLDPNTQRFERITPNLSALHITDNSALHITASGPKAVDSDCLSPWEEWMKTKLKKDKDRKEKQRQDKLARKSLDEEARNKVSQKVEQAARVHKQWVEEKKLEQLARQKQEHKRRIAERTKEEQQKELTLAKAKACYEKWYKETEERSRQHKRKLQEQAKQKVLREVAVRKQAQHAYNVWLKTLKCKKTYGELSDWSRGSEDWWQGRWNY